MEHVMRGTSYQDRFISSSMAHGGAGKHRNAISRLALPCQPRLRRRGILAMPTALLLCLPMKRQPAIFALLLALPLTLAASDPVAYQDGVLTRVRTIVVGNSCSSSTQTDAATYGNTARRTLDASARCSDIRGAVYTVVVGSTEYELTPDHSRVARASSYLPLSATFLKQSSLANHMAGTPVKLRSEGDAFFVLVGKRESQYRVFTAR